jgi:hypothetical protein
VNREAALILANWRRTETPHGAMLDEMLARLNRQAEETVGALWPRARAIRPGLLLHRRGKDDA